MLGWKPHILQHPARNVENCMEQHSNDKPSHKNGRAAWYSFNSFEELAKRNRFTKESLEVIKSSSSSPLTGFDQDKTKP